MTADPDNIELRASLRSKGYSHELIDELIEREANGPKRAAAIRDLTLACEDYDAGAAFFASNTAALAKKIADAVALVTRAEIDSKVTALVQAHRQVANLRAQSGSLDEKLSQRSKTAVNAGTATVHNFINKVLAEVAAIEGERVTSLIYDAERSA